MFWRLGLHFQESNVSKLLDRETPPCTLDELLEEDEIISECKSHNDKLITFLATDAHVSTLVEYMTSIPENASDQRRSKFPHVACEIFCCEVMDILDIFMSTEGDSNILSQFLKFLENDSPLNPSLTGYFHRVFMVLYSRFPHKVSDTIKSSNILPDLLLRHIGSYGIPEILLRLMGGEPEEGTAPLNPLRSMTFKAAIRADNDISADENLKVFSFPCPVFFVDSTPRDENWWMDRNVIRRVVERLVPDESSDVHANVSQLLCDIPRRFSGLCSDIIMNELLSESTITALVDRVVERDDTSVLTHGLSVLSELLDSVCPNDDGNEDHSGSASPRGHLNDSDDSRANALFSVLSGHYDRLLTLLQPAQNLEPVILPFGQLNPPLGAPRLRVVEFFERLFRIGRPDVDSRLAEIRVLPRLLDLFFQYEWHNILHCLVSRVVHRVLRSSNADLQKSLFEDCKLLSRIVETFSMSKDIVASPKGQRPGTVAHILSISRSIQEMMNSNVGSFAWLESYISAYPKWREFIDTDLQIEIRKQDRALGAGLSIMDSEIFVSSSPSVESDSTDDENLSASDENDVLNAAAAVQNALGLDDEWEADFDDDFDGTPKTVLMVESAELTNDTDATVPATGGSRGIDDFLYDDDNEAGKDTNFPSSFSFSDDFSEQDKHFSQIPAFVDPEPDNPEFFETTFWSTSLPSLDSLPVPE